MAFFNDGFGDLEEEMDGWTPQGFPRVSWLRELGEFTLLLIVAGLVGIGWVVAGAWGWMMGIVTGRRVKG